MRSHSATIICSIVTSLASNSLFTPRGYKFYDKIRTKCFFLWNLTHFSQDLLFIGSDIFSQVMVICLHLIKHVPLGFNTLVAPPVCILGMKLCFKFRSLFLKMHIFEVVIFYLTLWWSNQPNFLQWWTASIRFKFLKKLFTL